MNNDIGFIKLVSAFNHFSVKYYYVVLGLYVVFILVVGGGFAFSYNLFDDKITRATKKILYDNNIKSNDESYNSIFEDLHAILTKLNSEKKLNYGINKGLDLLKKEVKLFNILAKRPIYERNQPRELKPTVQKIISNDLED